MLGPLLIVVVLLLLPVAVLMSGAVLAAVLGHFLKRDVEGLYEGTEHVQLG